MFLFKKLFAALFFPVSLCLELLLLGLILLWATRRQKTGKTLVTLGTLLLAVLSYPWVPNAMLRPLEQRYQPLVNLGQLQTTGQTPVKWVVVLGGGVERLAEGVQLYRQLPGSRLILSGGPVFGSEPDAVWMEGICRKLGINPRDLVPESNSRDTGENAKFIKPLVGADRFILVTSASHMPRAMAIFQKSGLSPIAAPTDYRVEDRPLNPRDFLPAVRNLQVADLAVHEYLGLAWARLRGEI